MPERSSFTARQSDQETLALLHPMEQKAPGVEALFLGSSRRLPRKKFSTRNISWRSETFVVSLRIWIFVLLMLLSQASCDRRPAAVPNEPANSSPAPSAIKLIPLTN